MKVVLVAAVAKNGVIGSSGKLPWRLPKDMAHFRQLTLGKCVIVGRKTHESIGQALPSRTNIVVTRSSDYHAEGCIVVHSFDEALAHARKNEYREVMVIGGAELYALAMKFATTIHLTRIHAVVGGDVYFPEIDDTWTEESCDEQPADDSHEYAFTFCTYTRAN